MFRGVQRTEMRQRSDVGLVAFDDALERENSLIDLPIALIHPARFEQRGSECVVRFPKHVGKSLESFGFVACGDLNAAQLEQRLITLLVDHARGFEALAREIPVAFLQTAAAGLEEPRE